MLAACVMSGLSVTCMCRWGSLELPELPHRPSTSPALTVSP
jgi:hypothetical protein